MSYKEQFIWQKAIDLSVRCYKLTEYFPQTEIYGMTSQVRRCSVSIPIERRQKADGRWQKDRLEGDSNPPPIEDHQIEDSGGGFKPTSEKGKGRSKPSALCHSSEASSAFQGGSLGNIAEGYGRKGRGEYIQFLHIALGSARELDSQLTISLRVKLTEEKYIQSVLKDVDEIQRLLVSTINKLK